MIPDNKVRLSSLRARLGRARSALRRLESELPYSEYRDKLVTEDWIREALVARILELEGIIAYRIGFK